MNIFAAFCRAIDDGLFDDVHGAETAGAERLKVASDPFISDGSLTEQQQRELAERLGERLEQHKGMEEG